jgi:hypothetical protein
VSEQQFSGPVRLHYSFRGPEWAFAIPQGDLDALDEVMRLSSQFWNGAGALIVPISATGRIPDSISAFTENRPVEHCWLHPSLGSRPRSAASAMFTNTSALVDGFDRDEVHPLHFLEPAEVGEPRPRIVVPRFAGARQQRGALCAWGYLHEPDREAWEERFGIVEVDDRDEAARALIDGQTETGSMSPLRLSTRHMNLVSQTNPFDWPYLALFSRGTFNDYVTFWNWRSRARADVRRGASVIGVDRGLLGARDLLVSFPSWLRMPSDLQRTPELLVAARESDADRVDRALTAPGLVRDRGSELQTSWGDAIVARPAPTYRYMRAQLGGKLVRGTSDRTLVVFNDGFVALDLEQPQGFAIHTGHRLRLTLHNLPIALPLTDQLARAIHPSASAFDGLVIPFFGQRRISVDLRLPTRAQALRAWAADHDTTVKTTQPFRYAEALLGRLADPSALDAFADATRIAVLNALAPTQREKLAQRIRIEFSKTGESVDETAIAEHIKQTALFLELQSRSATDIGGLISSNRAGAIDALRPLVNNGLVVRGQVVRCPTCNFAEFRRLEELDEHIRCRSCRETFLLPLTLARACRNRRRTSSSTV